MTVPPRSSAILPPIVPDSASPLVQAVHRVPHVQTVGTSTVLKEGATFLVADWNGDITTHGYGLGLYEHDTRFLSRFTLRVGGARFMADTHTHPSPAIASTRTHIAGSARCAAGIEAHRTTIVDNGLHVHLTLRNTRDEDQQVPISLVAAADFRDMFEVRGMFSGARAGLFAPAVDGNCVRFHYQSLDGVPLWTEVRASKVPTKTVPVATGHALDIPGVRWRFMLDVPAHRCAAITFSVRTLRDHDDHRVSPPDLLHAASARTHAWKHAVSEIVTDHDGLNHVLRRSTQDLRVLLTPMGGGELPAAGIPWFVAPFGRDSCITAMESLMLTPRLAVGTLRALASTQGTRIDPTRDEEPGKIVHEVRYGELSRVGLVPHAAYYGSVDSTPLFVMLFAATIQWLNDDALYGDLLHAIRHALEWCDNYGDLDGDGYVEFQRHAERGILNQGWKDSNDSVHQPNGGAVKRPVALVEVQGYVYAAKAWLAEIVAAKGDIAWATRLRAEAAALAARIERDFWLPDEGTYAYALDAEKQPVRTVVSNAGHLLFVGLPHADRAKRLAARLLEPDMRSGWGIRTLSTLMARYDPDSYHNGSIWPHDNALIALGMRRCGQIEAAAVVASEVLSAGIVQPLQRIPELYAGYPRHPDTTAPVPYPVSCVPQAWSAASAFAFLSATLGLQVDGGTGEVACVPHLPPWLNRVDIRSLRYGQGLRADIHVQRKSNDAYDVAIQTTS